MKTNLLSILQCPNCAAAAFTPSNTATIRCKACASTYPVRDGKVMFLEPPATLTSIAPEHEQQKRNRRNWTPTRLRQYDFLKRALTESGSNTVVLDVGCGPDQFADITARFDQVIGVDFAPYAATDVLHDINTSLPFRDNAFDLLLQANVLEHIADSQRLLAHSYRTLRKGGRLVGVIPFLIQVHQAPHDYHRYTPYMLEQLLRAAGFASIQVEALNTPEETHRLLQRHFFQILFANLHGSRRWYMKGLYQGYKILNRALEPVVRSVPIQPGYTLGGNYILDVGAFRRYISLANHGAMYHDRRSYEPDFPQRKCSARAS